MRSGTGDSPRPEGPRLFFALSVPDGVRQALAGIQAGLAPQLAEVRPRLSRPEGFHLTLAFLGCVDPGALGLVREAGAAAVREQEPFGLVLSEPGAFPSLKRARVLWYGLGDQPALQALSDRLREALARAGLPFDPTPLVPHLTLARCRTVDARGLVWPPLPAAARGFEAACLTLYRSDSCPGGAVYTSVGEFPFPMP